MIIHANEISRVRKCPRSLQGDVPIKKPTPPELPIWSVYQHMLHFGLPVEQAFEVAINYTSNVQDVPLITHGVMALFRLAGKGKMSKPNNFAYPLECNRVVGAEGRPDICIEEAPQVRHLIKFNNARTEIDHTDEYMMYGQGSRLFQIRVIDLRDNTEETSRTFSEEDFAQWQDEVFSDMSINMNAFHIGSHCYDCPRSMTCPAIATTLESFAHCERGTAKKQVRAMSPADIQRIRNQMDVLRERIATCRQAIIVRINEGSGSIVVDDTTEIVVMPREQEHWNVEKAWPILQSLFNTQEILGALSIRKGQLLKLLLLKAPYGSGRALVRKITSDLAAAGALYYTYIRLLKERKRKHETA